MPVRLENFSGWWKDQDNNLVIVKQRPRGPDSTLWAEIVHPSQKTTWLSIRAVGNSFHCGAHALVAEESNNKKMVWKVRPEKVRNWKRAFTSTWEKMAPWLSPIWDLQNLAMRSCAGRWKDNFGNIIDVVQMPEGFTVNFQTPNDYCYGHRIAKTEVKGTDRFWCGDHRLFEAGRTTTGEKYIAWKVCKNHGKYREKFGLWAVWRQDAPVPNRPQPPQMAQFPSSNIRAGPWNRPRARQPIRRSPRRAPIQLLGSIPLVRNP